MSAKDKVLASQLKTKIVLFLKSSQKATFKDIKDNVNISTDALKIQLDDLQRDGVITRIRGKYMLTELGVKIAEELEQKRS